MQFLFEVIIPLVFFDVNRLKFTYFAFIDKARQRPYMSCNHEMFFTCIALNRVMKNEHKLRSAPTLPWSQRPTRCLFTSLLSLPLAYVHLDVYKRQVPGGALI